MALFLHFLNREIYRAVNAKYSLEQACRWLRVLTVGSVEPLYSNFSNLLEGGLLTSTSPSLVRDLLAVDQLRVAGERASLEEFVDSRRTRYAFDADRYPMYFGKQQVNKGIEPAYVRDVSATDNLQSEIAAAVQREKSLGDLGVPTQDLVIINEALPRVSEVVGRRESAAITRSLFAGRVGSVQHESAVARLISTVYVRQYMEELRGDIATGLQPLSAFEHLAKGDYAKDVRLLERVLVACGFVSAPHFFARDDNDFLLASLRGTPGHHYFFMWLSVLCRALGAHLSTSLGGSPRDHVAAVLGTAGMKVPAVPATKDLYAAASGNLMVVTKKLRASNKNLAMVYERQIARDVTSSVVLIVTATKVETRALLKAAEHLAPFGSQYLSKTRYIASELGYVNGLRLIGVQCEAGSVGPSGSLAVITEAIVDFSPIAIILGGIAFGAKPDKQEFRDILVSKMIVEYERQKVRPYRKIPRGQRIEASPKLLSLFRTAEAAGLHPRVHVGVMLSGEKLIDSKAFLRELLEAEPEAIGGEMEGAGLAAAASRSKTDWIVVKAIVDWAHKKATTSSDKHQYSAAHDAFVFILKTLHTIGL